MNKLILYIHKGSKSIIPATLFSILIFSQCNLFNPDDGIILDAIKAGDNIRLNDYLKRGLEINREYGPDNVTLLNWAITNDQLTAAYLLIDRGADIELISEGKSPLMYASRYNRPEIAKLLISRGADINGKNSDENTAFHYAAKYSNRDMLELLYRYGADINLKNSQSWTALDYAIINNKPAIAEWLESIGVPIYTKNIGDSFEGPFMKILAPDKIAVRYFVHDSAQEKSFIIKQEYPLAGDRTIFEGISPDTVKYIIRPGESIPPSVYKQSPRIFAIGDIHGQFARMIRMLKSGGVIDENLKWKWGDGHLVFIGDIFDRGEAVTEALWFIYNLEVQALEQNGRVHLLLGNHELMILNNDIRYLANKYYCLTSNLDIDYYSLYDKQSIIGRWIRTKNSIEIIGTTMFVHAGISPQLASYNLPVETINERLRDYLNNPYDTTDYKLKNLLKGNLGPVWYRGYVKSSANYERITFEELERILNQYSSETVVIGHTEVDSVGIINNGRTIHINIPLADDNIIEQALLIENGSYYRISSDMKKILLKQQD